MKLQGIKIELASVTDVDNLIKNLEKISNEARSAGLKAVKIAESANPYLQQVRKGMQNLDSEFKIGYQLFSTLKDQFKQLGMEMPKEIKDKFDKIENIKGANYSALVNLMLESKNIIDNRY